MSIPDQGALRAIWLPMAARNDWQLAEPLDEFLDRAAAEYRAMLCAEGVARCSALALRRTYSALIYRGLVARRERAAAELAAACLRLSLRDGWPYPEAEEVAQEMLVRVLERLTALRSPQGLLSWMFRIQRSVQRERRDEPPTQPLAAPGTPAEAADDADMVAQVEGRLAGAALAAALRRALPGARERVVLLRWVLLGDKPREIAADLGLPQPQVRLIKSRALQRLRADEELLRLLRELSGRAPDGPQSQEGEDDRPAAP